MFQIDPRNLTKEQREHVAGFLMTWPEGSTRISLMDLQQVGRGNRIVTEPDPIEESSPEETFGPVSTEGPTITLVTSGPQLVPTIDKDGLPWDERIHSSSKNFVASGQWRKRKGISDELVAEVEGQLKRLMAIPSPLVSTIPPPPPDTKIPPPPADASPAEIATLPQTAVVSAEPVQTASSTGTTMKDYVTLLDKFSSAVTSGKMQRNKMNEFLAVIDVAELRLLAKRLDLVPTVMALLEQEIAGK